MNFYEILKSTSNTIWIKERKNVQKSINNLYITEPSMKLLNKEKVR